MEQGLSITTASLVLTMDTRVVLISQRSQPLPPQGWVQRCVPPCLAGAHTFMAEPSLQSLVMFSGSYSYLPLSVLLLDMTHMKFHRQYV